MTRAPEASRVRERLLAVRERIDRAARRAGRNPETIEIIAVTKGFPAGIVVAAAAIGLTAVGENRVQEARAKKPEVERMLAGDPELPAVTWHLVGHLQRNKVGAALELFQWIDAVDSFELASELSRRLDTDRRDLPILVEIKTSAEPTKQGISPEQALDIVPRIAALPGLEVRGLMTMAPLEGSPRPAFRRLHDLGERLTGPVAASKGAGLSPPARRRAAPVELSMGMSSDFEAAVEEGATQLRLGTALFGPRPPLGQGA